MSQTLAPADATPTGPRKARGRESLGRSLAILGVVVALAAFVPLLLPDSQQAVAVRVLIFALMAIGWNLMSGYGGMFSFGHAAYFGVGAYADAVLLVEFDLSPWIAIVVGAGFAALVALLIGYLSFRYKLQGAYFALATFAFAEMMRLLAANTDWVNGTIGYHVPILPESSWWMMQFEANAHEYFWIGLGLVALCVVITLTYLRSATGRYTVAIRDNEPAAESLGINVMRVKLTTMALSGAITAVAGGFYAQYYLFVDPDIGFGSTQSIAAIVPAVIGGIGTIWGPLVGALILGPLSSLTSELLRTPPDWLGFLAGRSGLDVILYAVLLIGIVLLLPKGIFGTIRSWWVRR